MAKIKNTKKKANAAKTIPLHNAPEPYDAHNDSAVHLFPWHNVSSGGTQGATELKLTDAQAMVTMFAHMACMRPDAVFGSFYWCEAARLGPLFSKLDGTITRGANFAGPTAIFMPQVPTTAWNEQWLAADPMTRLQLTSSEFLHHPLEAVGFPIWVTESVRRNDATSLDRYIRWPNSSAIPPYGIVVDITTTGYHVMLLEECVEFLNSTAMQGIILDLKPRTKRWLKAHTVQPCDGDLHIGLLSAIIQLARKHCDQTATLRILRGWPFYLPRFKMPQLRDDAVPYQRQGGGERWRPTKYTPEQVSWLGKQLEGQHPRSFTSAAWLRLKREFNVTFDASVSVFSLSRWVLAQLGGPKRGRNTSGHQHSSDDSQDSDSEQDDEDQSGRKAGTKGEQDGDDGQGSDSDNHDDEDLPRRKRGPKAEQRGRDNDEEEADSDGEDDEGDQSNPLTTSDIAEKEPDLRNHLKTLEEESRPKGAWKPDELRWLMLAIVNPRNRDPYGYGPSRRVLADALNAKFGTARSERTVGDKIQANPSLKLLRKKYPAHQGWHKGHMRK
ncbi:hypothetical protein LTR36_009027 [Oleoguttula mirabilis]|uniref:Uncharacterized protein n=1 Tax=Oleoguttula mirabilis TaxID=1507867 RepID=A0AAV9J6G2_9PEZI|nr:hypothetical protein LTR36_009027 [Oleoguttula mirabilis]